MGKKVTTLDRRQRRKQERHRFRIYMNSVTSLSTDDFVLQTFIDLQAACIRSAIHDAVMIARTIQKRAKAEQGQHEQLQSSAQSCSAFTEWQIFCRIFCIHPQETFSPRPSLASSSRNTPDSALHAAASAGATSMIHFVLCCYVIFHLTDARLTQRQPQSMASWVEQVRINEGESPSNGESFPFEKNDWIVNLAKSYTRYIDDLKFSLPTLVGYVLPYLSPHTKLENTCKHVMERFMALKEGNTVSATGDSLSSLPAGLIASKTKRPDDTCGGITLGKGELTVNLISEFPLAHQDSRSSPSPDPDKNDTDEALEWAQDFVHHVDDEDSFSYNNDDSFSLERS